MRCETILCLCFLLPLVTEVCFAVVHVKGCNRTVRTSVGWIRWTGRMGRCVVKIRAPLRDPQVIELRVRRLQVGALKDSSCEGAFVQFSDGIEDLEDDVGRYCGHVTGNTTRLFLRKGPELSITMDSNARFAAENPVIFSAQFSVLPTRLALERHGGSLPSAAECSLECSNENYHRVCRITSPGFPGVYPRGIRCRISLESTAGRFKIGGVSSDAYNLMNYTVQESCRTENCEDHVEEDIASRYQVDQVEDEIESASRFAREVKEFDYRFDEDDEILIGEDVRQRKMVENFREEAKTVGRRKTTGRRKKKPKRLEERIGTRIRGGKTKHRHFLDTESSMTEEKRLAGKNPLFEQRFHRRHRKHERFERSKCVSDYLAVYENTDGQIVEITKFCAQGHVPQIVTRGGNVIVEFHSERDGTMMHDGFHLTLHELRATLPIYGQKNCEFIYKSTDRVRETVRSVQHWYPPSTLCSYKFIGKITERVFIQLKIVREDAEAASNTDGKRNVSLNYCPGNEITVYNGANSNDSLAWSYCDIFHSDINNIQVPVTSTGNMLLVQYYSLKGSFSGQEFTYGITYKFVKNAHAGSRKKSISLNDTKSISLRPVNFSALNLTDYENCNCDFSTRIGTFKSWFVVLVVLGVISFLGAIFTIVALLVKCFKLKSMETKLLQTPKR